MTTVIRAGDPLAGAAAGPLLPGDQLLLLSRSADRADVEALFQGGRRPGSMGPFGPGPRDTGGAS